MRLKMMSRLCSTGREELKDRIRDLEIEKARAEAKTSYLEKEIVGLQVQLGQLREEKLKLHEDLMVATGVKMNEYHKEFLERQMSPGEREPSYVSRAGQWAHMRTEDAMNQLAKEQRVDAKRMIEQLESELEN